METIGTKMYDGRGGLHRKLKLSDKWGYCNLLWRVRMRTRRNCRIPRVRPESYLTCRNRNVRALIISVDHHELGRLKEFRSLGDRLNSGSTQLKLPGSPYL